MWGVGGAGADMMERSSMNSAQGLASQVDMLINQARRFLPEIRQFPQLQIAKACVRSATLVVFVLADIPFIRSMTDIYFDNIFSDMKAHGTTYLCQLSVYFPHYLYREDPGEHDPM